jgi:hypothetical protein
MAKNGKEYMDRAMEALLQEGPRYALNYLRTHDKAEIGSDELSEYWRNSGEDPVRASSYFNNLREHGLARQENGEYTITNLGRFVYRIKEDPESIPEMSIYELPWELETLHTSSIPYALRAWIVSRSNQAGTEPLRRARENPLPRITVNLIESTFNEVAKKGETVYIPEIDQRRFEIIYEVFEMAGVNLPKIPAVNRKGKPMKI